MDETTHFAILLAIGVGFVSAGIAGNICHILTGRHPDLSLLDEEDLLTPVRAVGLVASAPWLLVHSAFWWFIAYPPLGFPILLLALAWSFLQGVFILTKIFGMG